MLVIKNIKIRKVIMTCVWILAATGIITLMGFVLKEQNNITGKSIEISIDVDENSFLSENDILDYLKSKNIKVIGEKVSNINCYELEKLLNAHNEVEKAEVAIDLNGNMKIYLAQRKPILRVITLSGDSYYIDSKERTMALSNQYTARVLIANGLISEPYNLLNHYTISDLEKDSSLKASVIIDDVYRVAEYISKDSLMNSLVQQIYVNKERELELVTLIGDHRIVFGNGENVEDKFYKLKLFYKEGLNATDSWKKYAVINLKYKDQVVCIKK